MSEQQSLQTYEVNPVHNELVKIDISWSTIRLYGIGYCEHSFVQEPRLVCPVNNEQGYLLGYFGVNHKLAIEYSRTIKRSNVLFGVDKLNSINTQKNQLVIVHNPLDVLYCHTWGLSAISTLQNVPSKQQARNISSLVDGCGYKKVRYLYSEQQTPAEIGKIQEILMRRHRIWMSPLAEFRDSI